MVFIDGTNLFYRLNGAKLQLAKKKIFEIVQGFLQGRQLVRVYIYTSEPHFNSAKNKHGDIAFKDLRVVLGDAIPTGDGNYKEKGVDALLVADLIYHAAVKNYDYALLVSTDTDFVQAIRRVDDFGCRTGVLGICCEIPDRLRSVCDETFLLDENQILANQWAKKTPTDKLPN